MSLIHRRVLTTRRLFPVLLTAGALFSGHPARAQDQATKPEAATGTPQQLPPPGPLFPETIVPDGGLHESPSSISDEVIGIQPVPERPRLLVEKHDPFLGPGFLSPGIELPTGAVWRPSLWVFGTNRSAFQYFQNHQTTNTAEVVDRLDLFTQLNLSGTERVLFGVRPLDHEIDNVRTYTSYNLTQKRYVDGWNFYPQTLFFEGDFGEIFPDLDLYDTKALDYGFSIGRQPAFFQGGMLVNADILDAVTVTRNTLSGHGVLNSRVTLMYAWDRDHRNADQSMYYVDTKAQLFGLFTETDCKISTVDLDVVYVTTSDPSTRDGIYFGAGATQRIHLPHNTLNSTLRVLGSFPVDGETLATGKGILLFQTLSLTPHASENLIYCTTFGAIGRFCSAARGVEAGGPLSPAAGILFARPQIGVFGSPLSSLTNDVVGGAIGYQILGDHLRQQLTFEVGGRQDTDGSHTAAIGCGFLYQRALHQHSILILNAAVSKQEAMEPAVGTRVELLIKF
jgi:hypothetical protein